MAGGSVPANLAPIFQQAGKAFGIPPAVLAGIASVESNLEQNTGPSSAGAVGLMQFEPGTARGLGVNPYNARSAIFGAAKLLTQYGYRQNPTRAIGAYNGGPGNPQYGYAKQVMSEAQRLSGQLGGGVNTGGLPAVPNQMGAPAMRSVTMPTFNQAGYKQAVGKFIAGQAVQEAGSSANPFASTPGATAGFSQALGSTAPLFAKGLLTTSAPNVANYRGTKTIQVATGALQKLAGTGLTNIHAGAAGDVNPIPGAVIGRTDMGVDANLKPGAPILAPNDAKVVAIVPNWYAGQPYVAVQLLAGPNRGRVMYVAEQISGVPRVGATIRKGQPITRYAQSGTGIEIGWASSSNPTQTQAQAQGNTGGAGHSNSPSGQSFRSYLGAF